MTDRPVAPPSLRVAVRVVDGPCPAYLAAAAEEIMRVPGTEVVLLLVAPGAGRHAAHAPIAPRLETLYSRLERRALRGGPRALALRPLVPQPSGAQVVRGASPAAGAAALQASRVDVLIDLAPDDGTGPATVPPQGRWRLRYAGALDGALQPSLARPEAATLAESLLSIELPSGEVVEAGVGVSALHRVGFDRDRDAAYWRSAQLAARRLAQLAAGHAVPSPGIDRPSRAPREASPAPMGRTDAPFRELGAVIVRKVLDRLLYRSEWCVLVRRRGDGEEPPRDLSGFRPIDAPAGRFYADPFVVAALPHGPRLYVEDCPQGAHRGRISSLRETPDGRWAVERVVLDDVPHRAYPHVLEVDGTLVLTPDSGRRGGVDLFLVRGPGGGLERVARCLDGVPASDPTLLWHHGRYWLFIGLTAHGMSPWDELHLYSAASLDGPWHPHPLNPIVADVRRARPAGRIFRAPVGLIRPGQDCSDAYGRRIVLSAITTLTPDAYEERPIGTIEPEGVPGIERTHTYSFDGGIQALDGFRRVSRVRLGWPRR
ncbi:MAG: hypothetical protein AB1627_01650 [Chloroflexota bacterium]